MLNIRRAKLFDTSQSIVKHQNNNQKCRPEGRGFHPQTMMKNTFCKCLALAGLLFCGLDAQGQVARYYNLLNLLTDATNDLTATLPAGTTNQVVLLSGTVTNQVGSSTAPTTITSSNIFVTCHEFDKAGFTFQCTGIAGSSNGLYGVQIYGSASKGAVWDVNPRWNFTNNAAAPGAQTYTVVTNLDLTGLDRLAFVFFNASANGYESNVIAGIRLKSSKVMIVPSSD